MKKTLIDRAQFKIMPWKNGGGVTAEIDISPAGTDFRENSFQWRISSAQIQDENQFSQFPGYDRILTVLSGEGLLLNNQELGPFETFEFQGEDKIICAPIGESVEDLGVIFKREQFECDFQILNITAPMYLKLSQGVHFFMPLSAHVQMAEMDLFPPQFLKIETEKEGGVEMTTSRFPAHLLHITLTEKS